MEAWPSHVRWTQIGLFWKEPGKTIFQESLGLGYMGGVDRYLKFKIGSANECTGPLAMGRRGRGEEGPEDA